MRFSVNHSMSKAACVLGLLGAALSQSACAHPVVVQPHVAIQPQVVYSQAYPQVAYPQVHGHQPVYAQPYGGRPVVVVPRVVPQVVYSGPIYRAAHGWGHGGRHGRGHGGHVGHGGWRH